MSNRFSTPGQFPAFLPRLSLTLVLMASLATGLSPTIARAEDGTITELFKSPLSDLPGKEAMVIEVEYGPSGETPIHRHDAHAFVYVLEGRGVSGGELLAELKANPEFQQCYCVCLTGRNEAESGWRQLGFDAYVQKPIGVDALEQIVTRRMPG